MQIITINESAYPTYRKRPDFIQRYVFPGGMLPTPAILKVARRRSGPVLSARARLPAGLCPHAGRMARSASGRHGSKINPLGFDDRFKKLWEFYLHYCEAGFRAEYIDVRQVIYKA